MKENDLIKIHPGTKFFRFIDEKEEPDIIRIISADNDTKKVRYFDSDGKRKNTTIDDILDNYKMLKGDGMILFTIVSVGDAPDVVVALKDFKRIDDPLPYAVCRQSIHDFFGEHNKNVSVGISVSQDTCPANIDFRMVLTCQKEKYSYPVIIYLDDTLEEILKFVRPKRFDTALRTLKSASIQQFGYEILGYCDTLKDLLTYNNFMYDFRKCFNIIEVPFHIDGDRDSLDMDNITFLEDELKTKIIETYMIEYTKEIDLKTIKRDYCLITSAEDQYKKVYILGYDKFVGDVL